jgi:hypothetical protein
VLAACGLPLRGRAASRPHAAGRPSRPLRSYGAPYARSALTSLHGLRVPSVATEGHAVTRPRQPLQPRRPAARRAAASPLLAVVARSRAPQGSLAPVRLGSARQRSIAPVDSPRPTHRPEAAVTPAPRSCPPLRSGQTCARCAAASPRRRLLTRSRRRLGSTAPHLLAAPATDQSSRGSHVPSARGCAVLARHVAAAVRRSRPARSAPHPAAPALTSAPLCPARVPPVRSRRAHSAALLRIAPAPLDRAQTSPSTNSATQTPQCPLRAADGMRRWLCLASSLV